MQANSSVLAWPACSTTSLSLLFWTSAPAGSLSTWRSASATVSRSALGPQLSCVEDSASCIQCSILIMLIPRCFRFYGPCSCFPVRNSACQLVGQAKALPARQPTLEWLMSVESPSAGSHLSGLGVPLLGGVVLPMCLMQGVCGRRTGIGVHMHHHQPPPGTHGIPRHGAQFGWGGWLDCDPQHPPQSTCQRTHHRSCLVIHPSSSWLRRISVLLSQVSHLSQAYRFCREGGSVSTGLLCESYVKSLSACCWNINSLES